eukprot:4690085-Amphidinium_carterae.1
MDSGRCCALCVMPLRNSFTVSVPSPSRSTRLKSLLISFSVKPSRHVLDITSNYSSGNTSRTASITGHRLSNSFDRCAGSIL